MVFLWVLRVLLLLLSVMQPVIAHASELLSITQIPLPPHGYLAGFKIETWGVKVLAVCHIPGGWTITAGKSADPGGIIAGTASLGVTYLASANPPQLGQLFLIDIEDYRESGQGVQPPSFSGVPLVGTYGRDVDDIHEVPVVSANLRCEPATRCP